MPITVIAGEGLEQGTPITFQGVLPSDFSWEGLNFRILASKEGVGRKIFERKATEHVFEGAD